MSKAKAIGTAAETAVVKYLKEVHGLDNVTRVVLHGKDDEGDIHIGPVDDPDMIIEVKSRKNECTYKEVEGFIRELEAEAIHTWGEYWRLSRPTIKKAFLVIKRPGKGKPEDWWLCWVDNHIIVRCRLGDYFIPKEMK